jgi:hypothetical protein
VTVRATPAIWALFAIGVGLSLMTVLTYIVFRVRRGRRLLPGAWFPMLIAVVLLFIQPMVFFLTFAPLYAGGSVEEHGLFWTTYCGLGPAG